MTGMVIFVTAPPGRPPTSAARGQARRSPARGQARRSPARRAPAPGGSAWRGDLVLVAVTFSVVAVVALWVAGRGGQALFGSNGASLTSAGRVTGLVASDLLLVQVLMMARIPWAERAFGRDRLARWHRWVGFTSFWLMVAHVVLITLGYGATERVGAPAELWALVTTYPGMLLAAAGTGLLVMVVVTSVRAARRRLRYESWHLLHLYAYLGVGLALPHQIWTGSDFLTSPLARLYWWSLYAVALGAVLLYRLGLPLVRTLRHRLVVTRVVEEAPGVVSLHLTGRHLHRLPARAGQFLVWRFLDGAGWMRGHPYSLSAAPHPSMLRITVKDLGDGSGGLRAVRPGTRVAIEGPYGALTTERRRRHRATLIAAGIGITPLRALLEELPRHTTLIYRARDEAELVLREELEALAHDRKHRVLYLLGRRAGDGSWLPAGWAHVGEAGALRYLVPDIARQDVYVCGPEAWIDAVTEALDEVGVPDSQVHVERFAY